jgi:indolepyruvate ferredoxin oxidoreductase beta subunit
MKKTDTVNYVLSGLGGQGILFMTRILAEAALGKGLRVMGAETHGMAQRGGSVVSHLRLGEAQGSLVRAGTARFLLALDENEAYRNLPFLSPGGSLYASAPSSSFPRKEVKAYLDERCISHQALDATKAAGGLGAPQSANLALLGFFSAFDPQPLSHEDLRGTVARISPERFRATNLSVFDAGFTEGRGRAGRPRP